MGTFKAKWFSIVRGNKALGLFFLFWVVTSSSAFSKETQTDSEAQPQNLQRVIGNAIVTAGGALFAADRFGEINDKRQLKMAEERLKRIKEEDARLEKLKAFTGKFSRPELEGVVGQEFVLPSNFKLKAGHTVESVHQNFMNFHKDWAQRQIWVEKGLLENRKFGLITGPIAMLIGGAIIVTAPSHEAERADCLADESRSSEASVNIGGLIKKGKSAGEQQKPPCSGATQLNSAKEGLRSSITDPGQSANDRSTSSDSAMRAE